MIAYGAAGESAKVRPPIAGPLMVAICQAPEDSAVARCSVPAGATPGNNADNAGLSKAVAIPITINAVKISGVVNDPAAPRHAR
jgi:hypothetical protein